MQNLCGAEGLNLSKPGPTSIAGSWFDVDARYLGTTSCLGFTASMHHNISLESGAGQPEHWRLPVSCHDTSRIFLYIVAGRTDHLKYYN